MIGKLDKEIIAKFQEFQEKTGKHHELYIEDVEFENISLNNDKYFTFIKGKNHYVKKYNLANQGKYPLATGSVKNDSIAYYINPIKIDDIVTQQCISFNKDGDSQVFYRNYEFLMDRHHIAIVPSGLVSARYLYFSIVPYFRKMKFGWGENVADVETVSRAETVIPKDLDERFYTSLKIQEAIVEFFEYSFNEIETIKERIDKRYDIFKRLKKALIPSTFIKDYVKVAFGRYAKEKGINFNIIDVEFNKVNFIEFFDTITPPKKIKNKNAQDKGSIPIVSQSDGLVNGYTDEEDGYIDAETEPLIIFGDHTTIVKYVNFKFFAGADGTKILKPKDKIIPKYAYYQSLERIKQQGYQRHFQYFKSEIFLIPKDLENYTSLEIQKIIADFIEYTENRLQKEFDRMDEGYHNLKRLHKTYLARTFSLIDWGEE